MHTVKVEFHANDFEKMASALEAVGFKMMARNFGCDDGDYAEVLPEDRGEVFVPQEYQWQVWRA